MPPSTDIMGRAKWLVETYPASTDMTSMVLRTGWKRSYITMLLRLLALSPEIHSIVRNGALNEKQIKRLTDVVRAEQRERILREMLCESSDN
jgi:hypothetical protein